MRRKIITINEDLCNGCGQCVTACSEGALELVNGKARLVKESFCDGLGDCIGECPTGALKIEEKETADFDATAVEKHLFATQGSTAVEKMKRAQEKHVAAGPKQAGCCPGSMTRMATAGSRAAVTGRASPGPAIAPDLAHWPVQLHLVSPQAPFFNNKELLILSTCAPVASADVHWRFIRGRAVVIACPKLDNTDGYIEKLTAILKNESIPKAVIVRMEVPCCSGLTAMVKKAIENTGRQDLEMEENIVSFGGEISSDAGRNRL